MTIEIIISILFIFSAIGFWRSGKTGDDKDVYWLASFLFFGGLLSLGLLARVLLAK